MMQAFHNVGHGTNYIFGEVKPIILKVIKDQKHERAKIAAIDSSPTQTLQWLLESPFGHSHPISHKNLLAGRNVNFGENVVAFG
jgi:hypothetical protein